ncbi:MAG: hypothetical protein ABJB61_01355 [bacterium]
MKAALIEIFEERKDLVREVLEESPEDSSLARAIEQVEQSDLVTRDEVFNALERNNRRRPEKPSRCLSNL